MLLWSINYEKGILHSLPVSYFFMEPLPTSLHVQMSNNQILPITWRTERVN